MTNTFDEPVAHAQMLIRKPIGLKRFVGFRQLEKTIKTDVVIIGTGPMGLSLASQLVRYAVDFVAFKETH